MAENPCDLRSSAGQFSSNGAQSCTRYPDDFQKAVDDLIDNWEGGYVFDPDDPGGMTKYGISARSYPTVDIKSLTRDDAIAIYYRDFWQKYKLDTVYADQQMRAKVFNMGVLMGMLTAMNLAIGCDNIDEYRQVCEKHFEAICIKHPECNKYLHGWTRRALA
ncbi:MAG: glycosyl hydrolase 108 family protein [Syntrophobacteraceae bacterium]